LSSVNFWENFNAVVVGVFDDEKSHKKLLQDRILKVGDVLLLQSSLSSLHKIKNGDDFLILEEISEEYDPEKIATSLSIVGLVIAGSFFGVPIILASLVGVIAMFVTKCLEKKEFYSAVNWEVIFLLAGIIPLGLAIQKTGAASLMADWVISFAGNSSPIMLLIIFYITTTIMTEVISNNASVVIMIPLGISVATGLELNPLPFAIAVMFAASTSFLTPIGYQTNTMVYHAGNYKFSDFVKVGLPLNILLLIVTVIFIPIFWPLK
jgi:di/tricarboxylate transporter